VARLARGVWPLLIREQTLEYEQDRRHIYNLADRPKPARCRSALPLPARLNDERLRPLRPVPTVRVEPGTTSPPARDWSG
jgi:hypothetical protein